MKQLRTAAALAGDMHWRRRMWANTLRISVIGIGVLASMATSMVPQPLPGPLVVNELDDGSSVRVTRLTQGLSVDCEVVSQDPFRALAPEHFTEEVAVVGFDESAEVFSRTVCDVALLEHPSAGAAILRWEEHAVGTVALVERDGAPTWIIVEGDLAVDEGQFVAPAPAPGCRTTELPVRLADSRDLLPFGRHTWLGVADGADDCAVVRLRPDDGSPDSLSSICGVPAGIFPFAANAAVQVGSIGNGQGGSSVTISDFDSDMVVFFHYDEPAGFTVDLDLDCLDDETQCDTRFIPATILPEDGSELLEPTFGIAALQSQSSTHAETHYVLHAATRVVLDHTCANTQLNWRRDTIGITVRVPLAAE